MKTAFAAAGAVLALAALGLLLRRRRAVRARQALAALALGSLACALLPWQAAGGSGQALSAAELAWFNQDFFNTGGGLCLPNQFLTCLYDTPRDIDLFALFYNGAGETDGPSEAERRAAAEAVGGDPGTDLVKVSAGDIDRVLEAYTGLTADRTERVGLDRFTYLPDYAAFYHFHGDTNAPGTVTFAAGERRGDTVRLYYDAYGMFLGDQLADSWACVTVEDRGDGQYWFVSHQLCGMPAIPTAYPAWEPVLTLPVSGLTAYEPAAAEVTDRTGDVAQELDFYFGQQVTVEVYRSADGNVYAACSSVSSLLDAVYDGAMRCFFTFPEGAEDLSVSGFRDVLGRDGVVLRYTGGDGPVSDYYTFDGGPALLARAYGTAAAIDLDGDGETELCAASGGSAQVFLRRDGRLYQADLGAMLAAAWPEAEDLSFELWDPAGRFLPLSALVPLASGAADQRAAALRWLFFDGDSFLVYRDERPLTDHVAAGVDAPAEVLERARAYVRGLAEAPADGALAAVPLSFDDWRIRGLTGPFCEEVAGITVEIWRLDYQLHTQTPENVLLAGGRYVTEDGWVSAGYPDCDYFYFRREEDGRLTYLFHRMENDCVPGTEPFRADLINALAELGAVSLADLPGPTLLEMMDVQPAAFLERLVQRSAWEQARAIASLARTASEQPETFALCGQNLSSSGQALSREAQAAWRALNEAVDSWSAVGGRVLTNSRLGLSMRVPAGWDAMAEVFAGGSGAPAPVFSLYEPTAQASAPGMGLVWSLTAYTEEEFEALWPGADGSEVLAASGYLIGSDDQYRYLLSTPTDVQFLEDDLTSCVRYRTLQLQSQQALEDFLVRNGVAPNPLCPAAGGCYRYTGSVVTTPEKVPEAPASPSAPEPPSDETVREILLTDYSRVDPAKEAEEDVLVYQTEAHEILAREDGGDTCTFYLTAWRCTFSLRDGRYEMDSGGFLPTALTFVRSGDSWQLSEYWTPGDADAYARDLQAKFPPEAYGQLLDGGAAAISQALLERCREDAVRYFTRVTGAVPDRAFQPQDAAFTGRALGGARDSMTYEERLEWVRAAEHGPDTFYLPLGQYREGQGCLAYTGQWVGTPHTDQYGLSLRFADGTLASLPLPMASSIAVALPDTMAFTGGAFVYTVTFPSTQTADEGQTLVHLGGTYRYTVDLEAKTVSLTVDPA